MDGSVSISVGSILAILGFLFQIAITVGAIAFSHGALNQRVRSVEGLIKDHASLSTSVTRLETEMESVGRELKGLREDLKLLRFRPVGSTQRVERSPYDHPEAREWVLRDEQ